MNRTQKAERVEELRRDLEGVLAIVVAEYRGLTVSETQNLRAELRKVNSRLRVVKNTLTGIAVAGTPIEAITKVLKGPVAIAFSKDPVGPAKALIKAADTNQKLVLKAGYLQGRLISLDEVRALSKLPGLNEIRASFLGTLNAVPQKFVGTLAGVTRGFVNVLDARKRKLEGGE